MASVSEYIEPRSLEGSEAAAARLGPGLWPLLSLSPHRVELMVLPSRAGRPLPWSATAVSAGPAVGRNTAVATAAHSPNAAVRLSMSCPPGPVMSDRPRMKGQTLRNG